MITRVRKALTAIFCGQALVMAGNILLVPLYLAYWSPQVYGEWLVLFSLAGYLSTLDLGMNMAVPNRLTNAYSRGDLEEYARCQQTALAFYLVVSLGASGLLAIAAWTLPFTGWLGLKVTPAAEAAWVLWLVGLYFLWAMPVGLLAAVYRTTGNLAKSQWIGNAQQVVTLGFVTLVLVSGGSMKSVATWQLTALMFVALFLVWDVRRRFPELVPRLAQASFPVLRSLILPSLLFGLLTLSNAITLHGSVLVLSSALGGVAVAVFVTSRTLVNLIRQIVGSFINTLWPEITSMEARGEWDRLRALHRLLIVGSTAMCIGVAATLWYEGAEVITVWTRGKLEPDLTLLRLLLVLLVLQSTWLVSLTFTASTNRHAKLSWLYLASAVVGIGVAALMVRWIGTLAVPIGLIIGEALACYHFVVKDTCQMIGEPYGPFALRLWSGLIAVVTVALVAGWAAHQLIPGPYLVRWLGVGAMTTAVSIVVAWAIWLIPEDRAQLVSRLRPLVTP